jgi:hypothetical protein
VSPIQYDSHRDLEPQMHLSVIVLFSTVSLMNCFHQRKISHVGRHFLLCASKKSFSDKSSLGKSIRTVTIRASDIAAIIDRNQYRKPSVIFDEMWLKYSPETFVGQTQEQTAAIATAKCDPAEKAVLAAATAYVAKDGADAVKVFSKAEKKIEASTTLSDVDKVIVLDQLKSQIFTSLGTRAESKTADLVEKSEGIILEIDEKFYNLPLCVIDNTKYRISGKVDRMEQVGEEIVLVEIKNRMRQLFLSIPDYEYIQVQTYFQIVPLDIQRAKLIQQYGVATSTIMIERDDMLWKYEILPPLLKFCEDLHKAMTQTQVPPP